MNKHFLSLLLAFVMVLSFVPTYQLTANAAAIDTICVNAAWTDATAFIAWYDTTMQEQYPGLVFGTNAFGTIADATVVIPEDENNVIVTLLGETAISSDSTIGGGQNVTFNGTASVNWKDWMMIGRDAGDHGDVTKLAKVTFDGAKIDAAGIGSGDSSIHISGAEKSSTTKGYGRLDIINGSEVKTAYVVDKNVLNVNTGSTFTATDAINVAGRPANETPNGTDYQAQLNIDNATVNASNHGLSVGTNDDANGIVNLTNGAKINTNKVTAIAGKSIINLANSTITATATFTNAGEINMDASSKITAKDFSNSGIITVDMTGATATVVKLVDCGTTGTFGTGGTNYKFVSGKDNGYELKVVGNDLFALKDVTVAVVSNAWKTTKSAGDDIVVGEGENTTTYYFGIDAFATVKDALDVAGENAMFIQMQGDVTENVEIAANQDITLDLNGYVLSSDNSVSVIYNCGKLTIMDSDETAQHYFKYVKKGAWTLDTTANDGLDVSEITDETTDGTVIEVLGGVITGKFVNEFAGVYDESGSTLIIENANIVGINCQHSAIYNVHANLTIKRAQILGNTAYSGSGIKNYNGTAVIGTTDGSNSDVLIAYNTTTSNGEFGDGGGGIYNILAPREKAVSEETEATVTINHVTIRNNFSAYKGGGISNAIDKAGAATITINDGVIEDNESSHNGGGISNYTHTASGQAVITMLGGSVNGNKALTREYKPSSTSGGNGGGIANSGVVMLNGNNVTISDNKAGLGGGIYNIGTLTIRKASIKNNQAVFIHTEMPYAAYEGLVGGVYNDNDGSMVGKVIMFGGSITGNTAVNKVGGLLNAGVFVMAGGSVTGNKVSTENGVGGVAQLGQMWLGGSSVIKNNLENTNVVSNLLTAVPVTLGETTLPGVGTVPALTENASIGITLVKNINPSTYAFVKSDGIFASNASSDDVKHFSSDILGYTISNDATAKTLQLDVAPCAFCAEIVASEDAQMLLIDEKEAGEYIISGCKAVGFVLKTVDGKYVAFKNAELNTEGENAYLWKYDGGLYAEVKTVTRAGMLFWSRTVTQITKYYLGIENGELVLSNVKTTAEVRDYGEHSVEYRQVDADHHQVICTKCGTTLTTDEHHYDLPDHKCVCGKINPAYCCVTTVNVTEKNVVSYSGFWIWMRKTTKTQYTIVPVAQNVRVSKVQYSTDGQNWTTGRTFTTDLKVSPLYIRVTDSNDCVTVWKYENKTVEKYN